VLKRGIMERLGYAPGKRLAVKVRTRDVPGYRDAAVIAISQLRQIYIYGRGADGNSTGYCNDETDRLIDRQSVEAAPERRRKLVWEVERRLAEDASRPILLYSRFATCMQPQLKSLTTMTYSRFNGWLMEDVWLDK